jgi:O-antigen ligase
LKGFSLYILLLLLVPLIYGGNGPMPLMMLELMAIGLFYFLFKNLNAFEQIPRRYLWFVVCVFLLPVLQLIPIPFVIWESMPGHTLYAHALADVTGTELNSFRAYSMVPAATEYAWLALLPSLVVFLFTLSLSKEQVKFVVSVFLGLVFFQAILGLMQYGGGAESILRFYSKVPSTSAVGTYTNRDHLAGLLEMALPLGLALLAASVGKSDTSRRHVRSLRQRLALLTATHLNKSIVYALLSIAILLGLIFTNSRTGNALAMVVIFVSAIAYSTRLGGRNVYGLIGTFTAIALVLALEIGMVPILNRFIQQDPLEDSRWIIFNDTIKAIGEFFPLGSGFGTFVPVYPRFQELFLDHKFINSAHNDYLQWIMEGGILAAILIFLFMLMYFSRWPKVWLRSEWKTLNFIQVGAGIGMLAMILHTFVDFNLHTTANQVYFAFLAGLFFYQLKPDYESVTAAKAMEHKQVPPAQTPEVVYEKKSFITQSGNPFSD